jgi:hypothetical protein
MPWRFVEMYGRTQFSDIVVFQALEENTRALRVLARCRDGLPLPAVQRLALVARHLAAGWELLRSAVPGSLIAGAEARLVEIEAILAPALLTDTAPQVLHRIAARVEDETSRAALARFEISVKRLFAGALPLQPLLPLSVAFQADSSAWQLMPLPGTRESDVLDGFERCYLRGREIALRQTSGERGEVIVSRPSRTRVATFAEWRKFAELTYHQLDSIRPSLSADNRARRWCLGRLIDAFCRHETVLALGRMLPGVALSADERGRVEALFEAALEESRSRATKLVPHAYAASGPEFRASTATDVSRFALTHHQPLPQTA